MTTPDSKTRPRVMEGAAELGAAPGTTLTVIGNFDGVHRGHQEVLRTSAARAQALGLDPVVLTFDPHPSAVLGRGALPVLTTLERKLELVLRVDPALRVVVEPFTRELSQLAPEEFASELLVERLGSRAVIVGQNFRFGRARSGDLAKLVELGKAAGFEAYPVTLAGDAGGAFSSTRIRAALAEGDLALVRALLGRPHSLSGEVVRGDGRGSTIGVPTANLQGVNEALPPYGVYACVVDELGERGPARLGQGVCNVGLRPTVAAGFSIEVHLFDFSADLYGRRLRLHLLSRLREERRFSGLPELVAQIRRDIEEARAVTEVAAPSPDAGGAWY
jgi:riboflavin kinase/FMN adenylyltransferase